MKRNKQIHNKIKTNSDLHQTREEEKNMTPNENRKCQHRGEKSIVSACIKRKND